MKPFNLEEALDGTPVITRDGQEVVDLHYFSSSTSTYPLIVTIDGNLRSYTQHGKVFASDSDSDEDLFMKMEVKTLWIVVNECCDCGWDYGYESQVYNSAEEASRAEAKLGNLHISTTTIEIEV